MSLRSLCVFRGCTNSPQKRPDLTFHRFPSNHRATEWIVRCGNDKLLDLSDKQLKGKRICSEHFETTDYKNQHRKYLNDNALPKLFMDEYVTDLDSPAIEIVYEEAPTETSTLFKFEEALTETSTLFKDSLSKYHDNHSRCNEYINTLEKEKAILQEKLKNAQRTITNLKRAKGTRRVTVDSVLSDAALFLGEDQVAFLRMQLQHSVKIKKEWTSDEQKFATSLYNVSPKAYNFLRDDKKLALPCVNTIRGWYQQK